MKQLVKNTAALAVTGIFLLTMPVTTYAAPEIMGDGQVFDAQYYADTYADLKETFGYDEALLYNHYLNYGKAEGRTPYASTTANLEVTQSQFLVKKGKKVEVQYATIASIDPKHVMNSDEVLGVMQQLFPTGTVWNNTYHYNWAGYQNDNAVWASGYGCTAFASLLSDEVYENLPAHVMEGKTTVGKCDIVFLENGEHQAFVMDVDAKKRTITVAEGNVNGAVRWDGVYSLDEVCSVIKRY